MPSPSRPALVEHLGNLHGLAVVKRACARLLLQVGGRKRRAGSLRRSPFDRADRLASARDDLQRAVCRGLVASEPSLPSSKSKRRKSSAAAAHGCGNVPVFSGMKASISSPVHDHARGHRLDPAASGPFLTLTTGGANLVADQAVQTRRACWALDQRKYRWAEAPLIAP